MAWNRLTEEDVARLREICTPERVYVGEAINEDYYHDELAEVRAQPEVLVEPLTTEEVAEIMKYAYEHNIPVTPRGAGTGLCGGAVAIHGGTLISTANMTQVLEIDEANLTATVPPGILLMEFRDIVESRGLFYPPDPGEKSATIGGNIMTNAGGMRAVRYGVTRDYVLGMEVVLADGTIQQLGGKVVKTSSGYNLMQLLCGSEGTLCVLTQATVKLIPEPLANLSLLAPFDSLEKCVEVVPKVLSCGCEPTAVEFMEKEVIEAAEEYLGKQFPDKSADAYLLLRLDGAEESLIEPRLEAVTDLLLASGANDVLLADTDERKMSIWDARGAFLEAIKNSTVSMDECDVVVPRDRIANFVRFSRTVSERNALRIRSFGHAGDGNLHLYLCKDDYPDEVWQKKCAAAMQQLYDAAREMGGDVSGEHGIGHAKAKYLEESVGEVQIGLMRGIKQAFDPKGILNPGKVISLK